MIVDYTYILYQFHQKETILLDFHIEVSTYKILPNSSSQSPVQRIKTLLYLRIWQANRLPHFYLCLSLCYILEIKFLLK